MIRYFLAKGDRGGSAVITEGLPTVTCSAPPPRVHIATLGMKTWCSACEQAGFIAPMGPRLGGTGPNGKPWALSGDVNVCGCSPAPVFHAIRSMRMLISQDSASHVAAAATSANVMRALAEYDEQYVLRDAASNAPLANVRYKIVAADGRISIGTTNAAGKTQRIVNDRASALEIYVERSFE